MPTLQQPSITQTDSILRAVPSESHLLGQLFRFPKISMYFHVIILLKSCDTKTSLDGRTFFVGT